MNDDKDQSNLTSTAQEANEAAVSASQQVDFLVKQLSADLDKLFIQIKEQRQMVKDAFQGDSRYQEITERIKDLTNQRKEIQTSIASSDAVKKSREELEDLNNQKTVMQDKLSEYLRQYVEEFGTRTVEDLEGNLKEIITHYRLVRRKREES